MTLTLMMWTERIALSQRFPEKIDALEVVVAKEMVVAEGTVAAAEEGKVA